MTGPPRIAVKRAACLLSLLAMTVGSLQGCAQVDVVNARNTEIPEVRQADQRREAVNERPDSVMYLPLGEDVLVPEAAEEDPFPTETVGPFELRGETLAGALQLILADYDIPLAFESDEGMNRKITVVNLRGPLGSVVRRVCSLADMYCAYEDGTIVVKDAGTFTVTLPPIGGGGVSGAGAGGEGGTTTTGSAENTDYLDDVATGLAAILGGDTPIVDPTTRTLIYRSTARTSNMAERYFQRLRDNTAMIVFETYIWEVSLNAGNSTGINWDKMVELGAYNTSFRIAGDVATDFTNPVSIGLPSRSNVGINPATDFVRFLSQFGAVKTISQPQITVLSGSSAELRVADTQNFISEISTTLVDGGGATTSINTDSVDSGFTLGIKSTWDKSTVYADIAIDLTNLNDFLNVPFSTGDSDTSIQLPQTSERSLTTNIRVRPGDSVLIAGLVRENDNFDSSGPGFMEPVLPSSRTAQNNNLELVIMLRPRVVVYTAPDDLHYRDYAARHNALAKDVMAQADALAAAETAAGDSAPVPVDDADVDALPVAPAQTTEAPQVEPVPVPVLPPAPVEKVEMVAPVPPAPPPPPPVPAQETPALAVTRTTITRSAPEPVPTSSPEPAAPRPLLRDDALLSAPAQNAPPAPEAEPEPEPAPEKAEAVNPLSVPSSRISRPPVEEAPEPLGIPAILQRDTDAAAEEEESPVATAPPQPLSDASDAASQSEPIQDVVERAQAAPAQTATDAPETLSPAAGVQDNSGLSVLPAAINAKGRSLNVAPQPIVTDTKVQTVLPDTERDSDLAAYNENAQLEEQEKSYLDENN